MRRRVLFGVLVGVLTLATTACSSSGGAESSAPSASVDGGSNAGDDASSGPNMFPPGGGGTVEPTILCRSLALPSTTASTKLITERRKVPLSASPQLGTWTAKERRVYGATGSEPTPSFRGTMLVEDYAVSFALEEDGVLTSATYRIPVGGYDGVELFCGEGPAHVYLAFSYGGTLVDGGFPWIEILREGANGSAVGVYYEPAD